MKKLVLVFLIIVILSVSISQVMADGCRHVFEAKCGDFLATGYDTHRYGFLWLKTCEYYWRDNYIDAECIYCGHENTEIGEHRCYEYHYDCGDQAVRVCPF